MFQAPGYCYVYFIYGMHFCVNVVTEEKGIGAAVLIRALKPLRGIEIMQKRRKQESIKLLCNGPGKLCQALGIKREHNGEYLLSSDKIYLKRSKILVPEKLIQTTKRIGIAKSCDFDWRFLVAGADLEGLL